MGVQVTITFAQWIALFPQFTNTVLQPTFDNFLYPLAQSFFRNDGGGPVSTAQQQTNLLNLVIAHLALIFEGDNTTPPNNAVGHVSSATEGSVTVQLDVGTVTDQSAFWLQTKYGFAFWKMTAPYRTFLFYTAPCGFAAPPPINPFNIIWPGSGIC